MYDERFDHAGPDVSINGFGDPEADVLSDSKGASTHPSSRSKSVAVMLFMGFLMGNYIFRTADRLTDPVRRLPPREVESAESKFAKAAEAFRSNHVAADVSQVEPLRQLMQEVQNGFSSGDRVKITSPFDLERMLQEMLRLTDLRLSQRQFRAVLSHVEVAFGATLAQRAEFLTFQQFEIKRVEFNASGDEALLYVRHRDSEGTISRCRWWCRYAEGRWRVYDFEDVTISIRWSNMGAAGILLGMQRPSEVSRLQREEQILMEVAAAFMAEDLRTAENLLQQNAPDSMPAPLKAMRHLFHGIVAMAHEDWDAALAELGHSEQHHPDNLMLAYLRACIYNQQERFEEARVEAEQFIAKTGGDADASVELVTALVGMRQYDAALQAARAGLDDDPSAAGLLLELVALLPPDQASELGRRFMQLPDSDEWFATFCEYTQDHPALMASVIEAYATGHPDDPQVDYYRGMASATRDR